MNLWKVSLALNEALRSLLNFLFEQNNTHIALEENIQLIFCCCFFFKYVNILWRGSYFHGYFFANWKFPLYAGFFQTKNKWRLRFRDDVCRTRRCAFSLCSCKLWRPINNDLHILGLNIEKKTLINLSDASVVVASSWNKWSSGRCSGLSFRSKFSFQRYRDFPSNPHHASVLHSWLVRLICLSVCHTFLKGQGRYSSEHLFTHRIVTLKNKIDLLSKQFFLSDFLKGKTKLMMFIESGKTFCQVCIYLFRNWRLCRPCFSGVKTIPETELFWLKTK